MERVLSREILGAQDIPPGLRISVRLVIPTEARKEVF